MSFSEWSNNKKKKKSTSFSEWSNEKYGVTTTNKQDDDIAPVKTTTSDERTWFQKGATKDGVTVGNVAKGVSATKTDAETNFWGGIAEIPEKLWDGILGIFAEYNKSQMIQAKNEFELADSINATIFNREPASEESNYEAFIAPAIEAEENIAEYIKKDLYDGTAVAKKIISDPYEKRTGINVEENSFLGEKSDELVQSGGQLAAQVGVSLIPGVGQVAATTMMAGTAFGSELENALQNGATMDEAFVSAAISAGGEVLTERIGGVKFGGKTLTDVAAQSLSKKFTGKVATTLVKAGKLTADATAEGAEEVLSGYMSAIGQKLTYMEDKEIEELFSSEDAMDSFIGGFVLGGTFGGVEAVTQGKGYVTGMTKNEQAVFDKLYNDAIAEAEKDGKTLTSKEKTEKYNNILENMENGNISIDTIEEVLGGEEYSEYKKYADMSEGLTNELNELGNKTTPTLADQYKYPNLQKRLDDINAKGKEARTKLNEKMLGVLGNDRLVESYNEVAKRKEAFSVDLSQYEGKKREAVERAVKSGVLNNTRLSHMLVDTLSTIEADKGITFDYTSNKNLKTSGFAIEGKTVNGFVKDGKVTLNVNSSKSWQSVVGHEISHVLEGTDAYTELQNVLFEVAKSKGELDSRRAELTELYKNMDADIDKELTADLVGDYLFSNKDFINRLAGNKKTFRAVYNEIKYLCKVATGKELTQMEKVRQEFDKVWKELSDKGIDTVVENAKADSIDEETSDSNVKYSIREEAPPKETGIAYKVFFVKDGKLYPPMVANPNGADTPMGVWLNADVGTAAPPSKTGRAQVKAGGKGTQGGSGSLAFRPGWHLGDLPRASQFDRVNPETGKKELFPENFVWAEVEYAKDVDYQEEAMSYGYTENGKFRHAYAGLPKLPENGYYRYRTNPKPDTVPWVITGAMKVNRLLSDAEVNEILEKNGVPAVHRQGGDVGLDKFGFDESGTVKYSLGEDYAETNSKAVDETATSVNKSGVEYDETSQSYSPTRYSLSSWNESDYVTDRKKSAEDMAKALGITEEKATEYIDSVNGIAKMIADDKVRLSYEASPNRSAFVSNAEYGGSIDFSTICKKRRLFTGTFEAIQNALPNTALTAEEVLEIRNMMKEKGYEVSCGLCYVEGSRANMGQYTKQFIERYKATNPEYVPNMAEMNTATGQEQIRKEHPEVYDAYEHFMNHYGKLDSSDKALFASQQKPKMYQLATEYKGEILKTFGKRDGSVAEKNKNGGLRLQSFSDFEIIHLIDSMQVIMDMSRVGLAGQAYTKVPDFAWALGDTGLKINLSLIAKDVDENGRLVLDEVEGMKESDAMDLRNRYSDNVGTIVVVFTDEQLKAAMADERIDYIIPYHRSQWKTSQYESMGLPENTKDYTMLQNESYIEAVYNKNGKKQRPNNYMPNTYWDFNKSGKENAEAYLKMCAENNRKPKFSHLLVDNHDGSYSLQPDGSTDGYWKTLIDFKMYNNDGVGVPQNPVTPNFNIEEAQRMLNEYTGGHSKFPVAKDIVEEFVSKHPDNIAPVKNSLSNVGEQTSSFGTPLKDLALDQDIAPVANVPERVTVPKSEQIANGTRSDELLYESLDNYPMQTIEQKVAEKLRAVEAELEDNRALRAEAENNYNAQIAKLQAEYNAKKNKNTKTAYQILQSISRFERLKASNEANFAKRISDLEARAEKMRNPKYKRAMQKQVKMQEHADWAANLLGNTSTWVDKKLGLQYQTNTERRNLRDIVRDEAGNVDIARADAIDEALNGKYNQEEAAKKRELAKARGKYAELKITKAEDAYIQMLGELRHNPETSLTEKDVKEYYEKHKNKIDTAKVDKVIEMARQDYDQWIQRVNAELKEQGMREIPYRQGYFPHFTEPKQNFIQKLLNWKTQDNEIPTSIAGLTETFKPVKSWQSFDKQRHGDTTDYSFLKGFDTYSEGVLDWIYHLDTLQKRRAVENHIRYTHSDEGIRARIKEVYANEEIDANEAQAQIEQILAEAKNPLNNFVQDFTTHTNILAGKKNSLDRTVEQATNRHIYSVMTNVQNRLSANMVLANVRSALTNFIPITQSWAQVSPLRSLQATKDTIANAIKDDGLIEKSTFLTNRLREVDKLYQTNWDKVLDKAGIMFEIVDNFSSQVIWRSKYNQNLANGMTESQAIKNADQFAENVMAGRSKGNEPTLFTAKNPFVKAFTMFQLEVNNQYGYLFKDVPNDLKAETNHWKLNLAKGYTTAFIGAYVYNALFSKLTGSDAALDPIGIIEDLLRDLGLFDDDEEKEPDEVVTNLVDNVVEELPFVGGLFGGGRIPISSALPYSDDGLSGAIEDISEGNWKNIGKEMMNPILNVGLPVGGGQIKKTVQGLSMFSDEHPVTGSYTDSGNLRFPVEDTLGNRIQAGIFGQYASENAREYFDNGYAPLKEKQIQEYIDVDIPIKDYWEYREGLAKQEKLEDKLDYISGLDLPVSKKNILANNVTDRKDPIDLTNYDDFSSLEEFDYATKNPDKYAVAKSVGGYDAYKQYSGDLYDIKADKDANGKSISGSRKEKVVEYINNLDADYYTKIILFKSEYPSDDTYNADIINYINERTDLTYEERVAIYTELGFRVSNGYVYPN